MWLLNALPLRYMSAIWDRWLLATCHYFPMPRSARRQRSTACQGRIGVALVLDDVPFGAADRFAGVEERGPVGVILADNRVEGRVGIIVPRSIVHALRKRLQMHGQLRGRGSCG